MISIFLQGGLGNQLFQIATAISYGIDNNTNFIFSYSKTLTTGKERSTYWDTILQNCCQYTTKNLTNHTFMFDWSRFAEQQYLHYSKIPLFKENFLLCGYFQSYKYFDNNKEKVLKIMGLTEQRVLVKNDFLNLVNNNSNTISIHFRRGDYKLLSNVHPLMTFEYYKNALLHIPNEILISSRIVYFFEEDDIFDVSNIIEQLKEYFNLNSFNISPIDNTIPDWKQLLLMSYFRFNIIANSSFSWWAGYLNDHPQKQVFYPNVWFGNCITYDLNDLPLPDWIKIENKN